jgi:hypothetical protein
MSRLESEVRPIVEPLVHGDDSPWESKENRFVLTRWACKTAFVLATSSNYPLLVPTNQLRAIAGAGLPDNVLVAISRAAPTPGYHWVQGLPWNILSVREKAELRRVSSRSYLTALRFGKLMILVGHWADPSWYYVLRRGLHFPVWLSVRKFLFPPLEHEVPNSDAELYWSAFMNNVGVADSDAAKELARGPSSDLGDPDRILPPSIPDPNAAGVWVREWCRNYRVTRGIRAVTAFRNLLIEHDAPPCFTVLYPAGWGLKSAGRKPVQVRVLLPAHCSSTT